MLVQPCLVLLVDKFCCPDDKFVDEVLQLSILHRFERSARHLRRHIQDTVFGIVAQLLSYIFAEIPRHLEAILSLWRPTESSR